LRSELSNHLGNVVNVAHLTDIWAQLAVKLDCHKAVVFLTFSFVENDLGLQKAKM
jgi:hypothetical protein